MRRSAAPSKVGMQRKFITPYKRPVSTTKPPGSSPSPTAAASARPNTKATPTAAPAPLQPPASVSASASTPSARRPRPRPSLSRPLARPASSSPKPTPKPTPSTTTLVGEAPIHEQNYYIIMYTKYSNKKHKTWEDGVLVLTGKHAIIKSMEGKLISKALTKHRSLEINGSLGVGGYDLEVMSVLAAEQYTSGRVFLGIENKAASAAVVAAPKPKKLAAFRLPSNKGSSSLAKKRAQERAAVMAPRHNPHSPDSLILQKPAKDSPGVPVVVDPSIATRLRPHQKAGVQFMWDCVNGLKDFKGQGCILADEMGLGKTLSSITLAWTMCKQSISGRPAAPKVVIVTPSVVIDNWRKEFRHWLGDAKARPLVVNMTGKEALRVVNDFTTSSAAVAPILIISYEMFRKYAKTLEKASIGLMICDEGHRLKNSDGNKTIRALSSCPTRSRVILTGTPVQNDLGEFFAMVNFVNPGVLGNLKTFRSVFQAPIEKGRDKAATPADQAMGKQRSQELARLTSQFVLRRTNTILRDFLPPKSELVVFCHLAPLQRAAYEHLIHSNIVRSYLTGRVSTGTDGSNILVLIGLLKKLCVHPDNLYLGAQGQVTVDEETGEELVGGAKTPALEGSAKLYPADYPYGVLSPTCEKLTEAVIDSVTQWSSKLAFLDQLLLKSLETGDRVVLVSNYTQALDLMQGLLRARGMSYLRLDGSVETAKRQKLVDKFNNPSNGVFAFLLSSKAGGVGLNLIGANRLVLFDPDWNPAIDKQAMARVWRDGQKRHVYIYRLLCTGTLEEKIYQRQILKEEVAGAVVDDGGDAKRNFSREDLRELFKLGNKEETECETYRLMHKKATQMTMKPAATTKAKKITGGKAKKVSKTKKRRRVIVDSEEEGDSDDDEFDLEESDSESDDEDMGAAAGAGAGAGAGADVDPKISLTTTISSKAALWKPYTGPHSLTDAVLKDAIQALPSHHRVSYVHCETTSKADDDTTPSPTNSKPTPKAVTTKSNKKPKKATAPPPEDLPVVIPAVDDESFL